MITGNNFTSIAASGRGHRRNEKAFLKLLASKNNRILYLTPDKPSLIQRLKSWLKKFE